LKETSYYSAEALGRRFYKPINATFYRSSMLRKIDRIAGRVVNTKFACAVGGPLVDNRWPMGPTRSLDGHVPFALFNSQR